MCKVYRIENYLEIHKIMNEIKKNRAQLENDYLQGFKITPEMLAVSERIDRLVNKYMRLLQEKIV